MTWPTVDLDTAADVIRGVTFSKGDASDKPAPGLVPVLRAGNIGDQLNTEDDLVFVDKSFVSKNQRLQPGDIVVCMSSGSANVLGKSAMLDSEWKGSFGAFLATVRPRADIVFPRFLAHYLRTSQFRAWASSSSGIGIKNIRVSDFKSYSILLPPMEEQRRIAGILDQADALRRLRSRALDKLNTLGQAIFHEMFGDSATNPKGWPMGVIGDLLKEAKYGSSGKANSEGLGLPMLRMGNVTYDGRIDLSDLKHIELSDKEFEKYTTRPGDLLFNRTNSKELVGKTAVVTQTDPMAFAGYLVRARANARGDTHYISGYLNSTHGKAVLRSMCKNIVGMANINAKEFQSIPIAIPPVELQRAYADKLASLRAEETKIQTSLDLASTLFNSLQHRAFKEEL
ncbi:restriction endonuclease subunit S [Paracoccus aerodenitrificans]|uniref:restriction endonuclease subunit S n=1 Tax=Paracoccus aerodenitrificans TaxID=3017781 RepID=UPI0022F06C75|nr:restriction endonuclease subunit S [Paracoccus aerodenitrificans]WBU65622.1 restriction endonuclease subunit S [Paracoccus aerodenitrificans]